MSSEVKTIEVDGETYEYTAEKPYRDVDLLEELYHNQKMSQEEIGGWLGCHQTTVGAWLIRLDIKQNRGNGRGGNYVPYRHDNQGYAVWKNGDPNTDLLVHRLLAVAEYGFDDVCGMVVHHKNGIKWDNRLENVELMDNFEHKTHHMEERHGHKETPWRDENVLHELYWENGMSMRNIANKLGCEQSTISRWFEKHGIDKRSYSEAAKLREAGDDQQTLTEAE